MEARLETERKAVLDEKRAKRAQLQPLPPAPVPKSTEDDLIYDDDWNGSYQTEHFSFRQKQTSSDLLKQLFLESSGGFCSWGSLVIA